MNLNEALADMQAFAEEDRDFVPTPSGEAFRDMQAFDTIRRRFIAFVNQLLRRLGFDRLNGDDVFKLMQSPEFWSRHPRRMLESTEVKHFMGGGSADGATGLQGTYALLAEGYRRAAEERGVLPREMQSITWEAVRGLFSPEFKRTQGPDLGKLNTQLKSGKISRKQYREKIGQMPVRRTIDRVWRLHKQGAMPLEQARKEILRQTNGLRYPDWHEGKVSPAGSNDKNGGSANKRNVSRFGLLGPDPESVVGGRRDALAADFSGPRISRRVDPQYQFKSSGPDAKALAEPEKAAARVAMAATKGGVSTFAEYVAMAADDLGYDGAMSIARVLERTWNTLRKRKGFENLDEAGKTADVLKKPAKAPPERPQVKAVASGDSTGTKNAKTNQLRDKAGFEERPDIIPETRDQWDMAAKRRMTKDPQYAGKLAEELLMGDEPRGIDPVEEMALNRHIRGLANRRQAGEDVREDLWTAISASERVGTVWGRSGVARQAERAADFSLEGIVRQHLKSVNEKPQTEVDKQTKKLKDSYKEKANSGAARASLESRPIRVNRCEMFLIIEPRFDDTYPRRLRGLNTDESIGPQRPECFVGPSNALCLFDSTGREPGNSCARTKLRSAQAGSARRARQATTCCSRELSGSRSIYAHRPSSSHDNTDAPSRRVDAKRISAMSQESARKLARRLGRPTSTRTIRPTQMSKQPLYLVFTIDDDGTERACRCGQEAPHHPSRAEA